MTSKPKAQHGGKRANAGRPRNPPMLANIPATDDPLEFLRQAMNDTTLDMRVRLDAAKSMLPFTHQRNSKAGKKENQAAAAQKVIATGKFAASAPPLRSVQ